MEKKVRAFMEENHMTEKGDLVIAGVSGGGDSMAMLSVLCSLCDQMGFDLLVVHVNHGIRGEEALRDQRIVEGACRRLQIPCHVRLFDVPAFARENKLGLEEAGRILRKQAFLEEAQAFKGRRVRIALAHNRNDLAETMIFHLARGSGLRGLSGMEPVSGEIIRPLLSVERGEILQYLQEREIPYGEDTTNACDDYTRNRIRHHILPALSSEVNSRAVAHLAEVSPLLRQADDFLTEEGHKLLLSCLRGEEYLLDPGFFAAPAILQSYAVLEALSLLSGERRDLEKVHVGQVLDLFEKPCGKAVSLPGGIKAVRTGEGVSLRKSLPVREKLSVEWILPIPGILSCEWGWFTAEIFPYEGQKIPEKTYTKWMDCDKIVPDLFVRTRREGDFLIFDAGGHKKKLKKILIDEKVPEESRDSLPLVARGREILWIVGLRMSERVKITRDTKRVLALRFQKNSRSMKEDKDERENQGFDLRGGSV